MAISSFKGQQVKYEVRTFIKGSKCQYLGPWDLDQKTQDTLLSHTLKVEEKKVIFVFLFMVQGPRYWHLLPLMMLRTPLPELLKMKWLYLGSWATDQKYKGTFSSSTLKV